MTRTRRLHSANDEFQLAASLLTNRKQRARQGRFVVEGVRGINEAVAHGWEIESFWYAADRRLSAWARDLLDAEHAGAHYELDPKLMPQLSGREQTSELLALVEIPPDDLDRIPTGPEMVIVAFDRPVSPGNLGSVIRSADALGAHGVVVTGHAADIYDPQAVRATVGSLFALPVVRAASMTTVTAWVEGLRADTALRVVGTSATASMAFEESDVTPPVLIALGNETKGLSAAWRALSDELVAIPMEREGTSLNVAAAAAVVLYECMRRRRARIPIDARERA
jgi:23S rRNA (uridine2479-2'-O)-methyltransferase